MLFLNVHNLKKCFNADMLRIYMQNALISFSLKQSKNFFRAVFPLDNG